VIYRKSSLSRHRKNEFRKARIYIVFIEHGPVMNVTSIHSLYEISNGQFDEASILTRLADSNLVNESSRRIQKAALETRSE